MVDASEIAVLGALAFLALKTGHAPAPPSSYELGVQALTSAPVVANPLVSGNYDNEQAIYEAVLAAPDAASALKAAQNASLGLPSDYNFGAPPVPDAHQEEPSDYNGGMNAALRRIGVSVVDYAKNPVLIGQNEIAHLQKRIAQAQAGLARHETTNGTQADIDEWTGQIGEIQQIIGGNF